MRRFEHFTDDELHELWDGLTMDDGIRYPVEKFDFLVYGLALEMWDEMGRRDIRKPVYEGMIEGVE